MGGKEPVHKLDRSILREDEMTLRGHCTLEEQPIGSWLKDAGRPELVQQLQSDHRATRDLIGLGQSMTLHHILTFGAPLGERIRFKEWELFGQARARLTDAELPMLAAASKRDQEHR